MSRRLLPGSSRLPILVRLVKFHSLAWGCVENWTLFMIRGTRSRPAAPWGSIDTTWGAAGIIYIRALFLDLWSTSGIATCASFLSWLIVAGLIAHVFSTPAVKTSRTWLAESLV